MLHGARFPWECIGVPQVEGREREGTGWTETALVCPYCFGREGKWGSGFPSSTSNRVPLSFTRGETEARACPLPPLPSPALGPVSGLRWAG